MIIYVVEREENIDQVADKFGMTPEQILKDNQLNPENSLVAGQTLVILKEGDYHTVREGETIQNIGENYGTNVLDLYLLNPQVKDIRNLSPGDRIYIPATPKLGLITVNGYCYPNIDSGVLEEALPNLTYLSIFSYQIREDGSLVPINDDAVIGEAYISFTAPKMVITNIDEEGSFSGELAHTLLENEQLQDTLLDNVIQVISERKYVGLDIDLEYLFPEDKELYNNFLKKASERLHSQNYTVSSAIAPKTSADQKGTLYEAHDYEAHGKYMDEVILMTYEWGYTYGEPMAVAPLNQVKRVLDYAVTEIPSQKILMGIPNYGYDWVLPHVEGNAAKSLSNVEAINLARKYGSTIQYNNISQSPYFYYLDDEEKPHMVWFEDARSIAEKLSLVLEYNLGGVSYWTVNRPFPENWLVLTSLYDVKKVI